MKFYEALKECIENNKKIIHEGEEGTIEFNVSDGIMFYNIINSSEEINVNTYTGSVEHLPIEYLLSNNWRAEK